jgi:hypothetical protein
MSAHTHRRLCAVTLAVTATATSACIAVIAGSERGGEPVERAAWIFIGLILLLSAHLLPALARTAGSHVRCAAAFLWPGAVWATSYGHAIFLSPLSGMLVSIAWPCYLTHPPPASTQKRHRCAASRNRQRSTSRYYGVGHNEHVFV